MRLLLLLIVPFLLTSQAFAAAPRLLFDQGHRQAFLIEKQGPLQLRELASIFEKQGWQVDSSSEKLTGEVLKEVDALIVSGAFAPFAADEIEAILAFIKRGGKLAVMIHIGQPLTELLHALGVEYGNVSINENQNQPDGKRINFAVEALRSHPLTEGLERFHVYGGWPLRPFTDNGRVIASSSPHSWVDLNRDRKFSEGDLMSPFAVVVSGRLGRGEFAVFCDDAIFQNRFLQGGNRVLAENLGRWLKGVAQGQVEI